MAKPLEKWKSNQVFKAIEAAGLDPREFEFVYDDEGVRIDHRRSEAYFLITDKPGGYEGRTLVGDGQLWPYDASSWAPLMIRVGRWLKEVKDDVEMPDLWAELQRDSTLLEGTSDEATANTPFTPEEQREIAAQLQRLREHVERTYSPSHAQMRELDEKLDYLVKASGRLGRTDWRGVFVGVMLTFLLATAFPPESARGALHTLLTLLRAVGHLFGHEFPELPSG